MGDHNQYGLPDLRQLLAGRTTNLEATQQAIFEPFFVHNRNLAPPPPPPLPPSLPHHPISHFASSNSVNGSLPISNNYLAKLDHHYYYCTSNTDTTTGHSVTAVPSNTATLAGVELESSSAGWNVNNNSDVGFGSNYNVNGGCNSGCGGGNSTSRWPRQETLTLLEIRSRLDHRFKEANQKGPLWDEVSRIMAEEFGYQRSGKKCREKFENLYKYYKKTKEGKAGRQDGKHYRFFRQLEAIYGETSHHQSSPFQSHLLPTNDTLVNYHQTQTSDNNNNNKEVILEGHNRQSHHVAPESLSFTTANTSELETSSSENNDEDLSAIACMMNRSKGKQKGVAANEGQSCDKGNNKRGWKVKVKDYVELRMRKMMETQEYCMERIMKSVEDRELERSYRQEEWMKKEEDRLDREHEHWAKERAWMEARDTAFIDALKIHAGNSINKGLMKSLPLSIEQMAIAGNKDQRTSTSRWSEPEILSLIQLRTSMEPRFRENGSSRQGLWEEIAGKMVSWGYHRGAEDCMKKWENMDFYFDRSSTNGSNERRRQDYFRSLRSKEEAKETGIERIHNMGNSHAYMSGQVQGSFYQGQVSGGEIFWDKNDLKLN